LEDRQLETEPASRGIPPQGLVGPRGRLRYVGWTVVSQALNAFTNLLFTLQLARALPARNFATAALTLAVLALTVAGVRGWLYEPAVVHGDLSRPSCRQVLGNAAASSAVLGLVQVVVVTALSGPVGLVILLVAGSLTAVVQDAGRFLLIAMDRPRAAAASDLVWLIVQVLILATVGAAGMRAGIAWVAGGVAAALIVIVTVLTNADEPQVARTPRRVWQWGAEHVIASGALQLAVLVVPLTGDVRIAGGLRGAASLLGAATVLMGGAHQAIVGRLRRVSATSDLWALGVRAAILLGVVVSVGSVPLLFLSDSMGTTLLGDTWPMTSKVLPFLVVQRVASAIGSAPAFVLRREATLTSGVWWRTGLTGATVAGVAAAAATGSSAAVGAVLAVGAASSIPIWFGLLAKYRRPRSA
jgi:hypothetical protein